MSIVSRLAPVGALCVLIGPPVARAHDGPHAGRAAPAALAPGTMVSVGERWYEPIAGWCRLPDERPLGNTHGGIAIDRAGLVYYNTDTDRSIMVHDASGGFRHALAPGYPGIHGMIIRAEGEREFIYAAHLGGKQVLKLRLDGTLVWALGVPMESGKYDDDPRAYSPTAVAVGPGGDVYVADGYGRNWIHQFGPDLRYVRSFGGPGVEPGRFRTCHGLALDTRGRTPVLLVCDRENRRLQRFGLDGRFIDVAATGLRRPCSVSIHGSNVAVAELEGRVTVLDEAFAVVGHVGDNPNKGQWANNGVPAADWVEGIFTAPHACCYDDAGNLYVMDWNATGRISKLRLVTD